MPAAAQARTQPALARVVILATGGTIAGARLEDGEPSYKVGSFSMDALMAVAAMDLSAQKARVRLRLTSTKTQDPKEIQRCFEEY